ncbi:ribosome biogenesis GTPase Der [Salibacter halophilus]|uniref:GTPase Der n=1 Tax=Salibacter halophilus TaxID=1803916 RepID=A0A6N6M1W6_9FLAO|nr:ribosome biogenesis GTPase Der [Salibacter halophilus]KAB1062148.1 ribosome biogenesis GTPase Der [Salibacter halophilus]
MSNMVAIVGRPNVGKSTFFNRLVGTRDAIVDEFSGVTRDRHYGKTEWIGKEFSIIDTGGYVTGSDDVFEDEIRKQVQLAVEEADVIMFVVDTMTGITDMDNDVANLLRKQDRPVFVVANKADTNERKMDASEFYAMGLGEPYPISAMNGSGTGDLLDEVVAKFPKPQSDPDEEAEELPRISVVGRPNAGKSSFINALTGSDRNIVTPVSGTTRDSIDTHYKAYGFDFTLVDTAGLRKKSKVHDDLEFYSVMRSIRSIESSDVCILMIDAEEGFHSQDLNIFSLIAKNNKAVVILVNKWDLIEKDHQTAKKFEKLIRSRINPFDDVEIIFTSVLTKQRIHKSLDAAIRAYENRKRRIKTSPLNDYFQTVIAKQPPPALKGKYIKIKYVTQLPTKFPSFAFFANLPQYVKEPYKRFLENKLRDQFDFTGTPVRIFMRKK